jgi:hypothetical protein
MSYLIIDAFKILRFHFPEFNFNQWAWVLTIKERLSRVFL